MSQPDLGIHGRHFTELSLVSGRGWCWDCGRGLEEPPPRGWERLRREVRAVWRRLTGWYQ